MITSYTVGAIFEIQAKEATATLERLGVAFAGLDEKITALQTKMGAIGKGEGLFTGLLAGIEAVGTAFGGLGVKATEAGDAIVRAMERGAVAARTAASEINAAIDAAGRMGAGSFRETSGAGPRSSPAIMPNIPLIGSAGGSQGFQGGGFGGGGGGLPAPFYG